MSLDPAIVFVLSLLFLNNWALGIPKNVQQLISALVAVGGVWLLVYGAPTPDPDSEEIPVNKTQQDVISTESENDGDKYGLGVILVCIAAFLRPVFQIDGSRFLIGPHVANNLRYLNPRKSI